jgi:hypothetical protein
VTTTNSIRWERVEPGHYAGRCDELNVTFVAKRTAPSWWLVTARWAGPNRGDVLNDVIGHPRTLVGAQTACRTWKKPK